MYAVPYDVYMVSFRTFFQRRGRHLIDSFPFLCSNVLLLKNNEQIETLHAAGVFKRKDSILLISNDSCRPFGL